MSNQLGQRGDPGGPRKSPAIAPQGDKGGILPGRDGCFWMLHCVVEAPPLSLHIPHRRSSRTIFPALRMPRRALAGHTAPAQRGARAAAQRLSAGGDRALAWRWVLPRALLLHRPAQAPLAPRWARSAPRRALGGPTASAQRGARAAARLPTRIPSKPRSATRTVPTACSMIAALVHRLRAPRRCSALVCLPFTDTGGHLEAGFLALAAQ